MYICIASKYTYIAYVWDKFFFFMFDVYYTPACSILRLQISCQAYVFTKYHHKTDITVAIIQNYIIEVEIYIEIMTFKKVCLFVYVIYSSG